MKRIEVKLALPVVAPLLDVIKELADNLRKNLAAPIALKDLDSDFHAAWVDELLQHSERGSPHAARAFRRRVFQRRCGGI